MSSKQFTNLLVTCLCRVTSSAESSVVRSSAVDYPVQPSLTFPAPPVKRSRQRSSAYSGSAKLMKTKPHTGDSSLVDQNANGIELATQTSADGQDKSDSCHISERRTDEMDGSSTLFDGRMHVLWSGLFAVNGTELCSAELVSCCHIRHTL